jgi:RNA polymerase sigma-70 factor (ECF subfamily)
MLPQIKQPFNLSPMTAESEGTDHDRSNAGLFEATHWSVVMQARDKSETALSTLFENYRQPLLVWLRSNLAKHGQPTHLAEDQVQSFMVHLLSHSFLQNVSPDRGRFRTFLLRCLKNHLQDQADKSRAAKRGGGQILASLDETNADNDKIHDPACPNTAPDLEFDRAWARTVLTNSLHRLEHECARQGHEKLWAELQPVMFADKTSASYRAISEKLGMSEAAVKVAAHRMRTRLRGIVREEVLQTVGNEQDWEQEVRYLIQLFAR